MRRTEAKAYAKRMNDTGVVRAEIVRILPAHIDPIQEGDNGWDVEMTVIDDDFQTIVDQDRSNNYEHLTRFIFP